MDLVKENSVFVRHLNDLTILVGMMQVLFALLALFERLNPTIDSRYIVIDTLIDDNFWAGVFLLSGISLLIGVKFQSRLEVTTSISSATLLVWGALCLLKSVTTVEPVAWSVGLSVLALGIVAYKLCVIWAALFIIESHKK